MKPALLRIAWREFAGSLMRFRIYLACLGVGAFAIAAAGSTTQSFREGVTDQARILLGGDVSFTLARRTANAEEAAYIASLGEVSATAMMRTMAQSTAVRKQVDMRAVDSAFPLLGEMVVEGADPQADALAQRDGRWGAVVSQSFLDELNVEIGDPIALGTMNAYVAAKLVSEPDRLGESGVFQPTALVSMEAVQSAGLLDPGQLFRSTYLVRLSEDLPLDELEDAAREVMGEDGPRMRRPEDAVDGLQRLLDLLNSFLSVVGVAALVAGGLGISQATSAFLESRIGSIAALKSFGASGADIRTIYLIQLMGLAVLGAAIGVTLGAATPVILELVAGESIPLPQETAIYPAPLLIAFALSLCTAAAFSLPALGRARATPPAALFRRVDTGGRALAPAPEMAGAVGAAVLLLVIGVATSPRPLMSFLLLVGAGVVYAVLVACAQLIRMAARRVASRTRGMSRLLWSNLGGANSLAPQIAPALGLGLALLVLVASVQDNLLRQIGETAPQTAPALVFSQIANREAAAFDQLLSEQGVEISDPETYQRVPTLLARIVSINGVEIEEEDVSESERWVIGREVNVTYLDEQPDDVELHSGEWWPADYDGSLLVSVEQGVAEGLKVDVGDRIAFRISGRTVESRMSSVRRVDWGGFGVNRPFVFSPGQLSAANPQHFAIAQAPVEREVAIINAVGEAFPEVIVFQTREALATARRVVGDISIAVNAIAGVVTVAGLLVLLGALATIARKRKVESAILKTIGATRPRLLGLYAVELGLAGAAAALVGVVVGVGAALPVVVVVFEATWSWPILPVTVITAGSILVCAIGGAIIGAALLAQRPMQALRTA